MAQKRAEKKVTPRLFKDATTPQRRRIGKNLTALMKARKLSNNKLAAGLHCSEASVRTWRSGRGLPSREKCARLLRFLAISLYTLTYGTGLFPSESLVAYLDGTLEVERRQARKKADGQHPEEVVEPEPTTPETVFHDWPTLKAALRAQLGGSPHMALGSVPLDRFVRDASDALGRIFDRLDGHVNTAHESAMEVLSEILAKAAFALQKPTKPDVPEEVRKFLGTLLQ